eukprot:jgi/Bigna1/65885/fgenesh1_kg.144_\
MFLLSTVHHTYDGRSNIRVTQSLSRLGGEQGGGEGADLKEELEDAIDRIEAMEEEVADLSTSYGELEEENKRLKSENEQKETVVSNWITKSVKLNTKIKDCEQLVGGERSKCLALQQQVADKEEKYKALEILYAKEKELMVDKSKQIESLTLQLYGARRQAKEASLNEEKERSTSKQHLEATTILRSQVTNQTDKIKGMDEKITELTRKVRKLERREAASKKRRRKKNGDLESCGHNNDDYDDPLLEEYRKKLKCPLCSDGEKGVIILRCQHMFCRECIEKNLKVRNRNCPACNISFSKNDVRSIFL